MAVFGQNLAAKRAAAIEQVRQGAAEIRAGFVTALPGQDMIYQKKEAEAARYLADPAPDLADYPWISAEIGITAQDAPQVAQVYVNLAAEWSAIGARLETLRLGAVAEIEAAARVADLGPILDRFAADLAEFRAGLAA